MSITAFTIISENYLPQAKTLADSFTENHPDISFKIYLFNEKDKEFSSTIEDHFFSDYNCITLDEKLIPGYNDMRNRYDNFSMACALKAFVSEYLFCQKECTGLIYLDADIYVFSQLNTVLKLLADSKINSSIILTPHNISIINNDFEVDKNISFLTYGIFNAGFFAVKNNSAGKEFIEWWKRMLMDKCIVDLKSGLYCDQTWLDLVTVLFKDSLHILEHRGYNVAYWNIDYERVIDKKSSQKYLINESDELVLFHFARFRYFDLEDIIPGVKFKSFSNSAIIIEIYNKYRSLLKLNRFEDFQREIDQINTKEEVIQESILVQFKNKIKWKLINLLRKL